MSGAVVESCGIFTNAEVTERNSKVGGHRSAPGSYPAAYRCIPRIPPDLYVYVKARGELSYSAPLGSKNIFASYFKRCFLQGGGITPQTVKHHASQSQDRNNKYFILYIEFFINNKI